MAVIVPIISEWNPKGVDRAIADFKKAEGKLGKMKVGLDKAFLPAVGVLGAMGTAAFISAQKASDLAETTSKVGVIFGDAAADIEAFSKSAPRALGQTQDAAMEAASQFATFGKAAGLTGSDLTGFSTELVTLSSDLASFNNVDPASAAEALGAALRGESEPMRKFGVMLNDATLKAEAMELGIYDGNGALTAQQKVLAAQAAIMKQTTDAQGDFERTSDGAANQQRILAATMEQLQTDLGATFLPILEQVTTMLSNFAEWASKNQGLVMALAGAIAFIAGVIVTLKIAMSAWTAVQWALNAAMAANPIVLIVLAIVALIAIVVLAYHKVDWFRDLVDTAWEAIQTAIEVVVDWFAETAWPILKKIFGFIGKAVELYIGIWRTAFELVWEVMKIVFGWLKDTFGPSLELLWEGLGTAVETLGDIWGNIFEGIQTAVKAAWDFISPIIDKIKAAIDAIKGAWDAVSNIGGLIGLGSAAVPSTLSVRRRDGGPVVNVNVNTGIGDPIAIARAVEGAMRSSRIRLGTT